MNKQEAYKAYLAQRERAQEESGGGPQQDGALSQPVFDQATVQRRQLIFEKINRRKKMSKAGGSQNKQVQYQTVVREVQLDPTAGLVEVLMGLFRTGRKLKPLVKKRPPAAVEGIGEAKLLVHLIRGTSVPIRLDYYEQYAHYQELQELHPDSKEHLDAYKGLFRSKDVEPFVEVRLVDTETGQEEVLRTGAAEGQCPEWNEILEFSLKAKNKIAFTKTELEQSKYMIYFTLFDQELRVVPITKAKEERYQENKYLGQFAVPLTTVLRGQRLEGQVRVNRPLVLQNYRVVQEELIFMDSAAYKDEQQRAEEQTPTYLNVTISLEPLISIDQANEQEYYQGYEKTPFL